MDCSKVGMLILGLRKEKNMTQKELADALNLSDRTISKWERGLGCPDVSLLNELSQILGVNIEKILAGDLDPNDNDGGNMNRVKFYVCPTCGNSLLAPAKPIFPAAAGSWPHYAQIRKRKVTQWRLRKLRTIISSQ